MKVRNYKITLIALTYCFFLFPFTWAQSLPEWYVTTQDAPFQKMEFYSEIQGQSVTTIELDLSSELQVIDGWGGSFNELGWKAVSILDKEDQYKVMKALFDPENGCGFDYCRMPMGASDFALNYYSFNDHAGDYKMKKFSIERDQLMMIPYIRAAMAFQPDLRVWGSPWTPPAWMKDNGKYYQGTINMDDKNLSAFALYFEKYIKDYRKEGINVVGIHVQNEPLHLPGFPSCGWTGEQLRVFIADYLGPRFEKSKLDAEIWLGTINGNRGEDEFINYIQPVLSDPAAYKYITGSGFQWYGDEAVERTVQFFPSKKMMQTEAKCGNGTNTWEYAVSTFDDMHWYFTRGANSYMQWNMVLDDQGFSSWGWKQNAMISIDTRRKNIIYNPQFYMVKHFSKFVPKGSRMLYSDLEGKIKYLAFKTPESRIVVVFHNSSTVENLISFKVGNKTYKLETPSDSFNTLVFN